MTFRKYLTKAKTGPDALRDFMRLAKADQLMPDVTSWDELIPPRA